MRFIAALVGIVSLVLIVGACFFDSGSGGVQSGVIARLGPIPTATLPAPLPEPVLLGQSQGGVRTAVTGGGEGSYVVKSGDTLAGIAISRGVPVDQQAAWIAEVLRLNSIADPRLIGVGVELRLPRVPTQTAARAGTETPAAARTPTTAPPTAAAATATTAAPASTPRPPISGGSGTYTVVSGDFPLLIAEKLGVPPAQQLSWAAELIALNNLNPNAMTVGTVLQLPAGTPSGPAQTAPPATPTRVP